MRCPTCGRDTSRSEGWSTGQCDDCYIDDHLRAATEALDRDEADERARAAMTD
jgi:hypothetical protein